MRYDEERPKIRSGDLLGWSHERWGSWYDFKVQMVRVFTRSEFCHVGIAHVSEGRVWVLEAVKPLVRHFPLSKLRPFRWLPMGLRWDAASAEYAFERVGDPYSERQAAFAFLGRLKIGADRVQECAEYVIDVYRQEGVDLGPRAVPTDVIYAAKQRGCPEYLVE